VADNQTILANPRGKVIGSIIEAERDRAKGVMATLLIQNGMSLLLKMETMSSTGMVLLLIKCLETQLLTDKSILLSKFRKPSFEFKP